MARRVLLVVAVVGVALAIACARATLSSEEPLVNVVPRPTTAEQVLTAVREAASHATGISAELDQDVVNATFGSRRHTHGTLVFAKPEQLRLDYDNRKSFISNGSDVWIVEPDNLVVTHAKAGAMAMPAFAAWRGDDLGATHAVTFATSASPHAPAAVAGSVVLELVPKVTSDTVARMYFVVDTATSSIVTAVVVDPHDNTNTFTFSHVRLDATPTAATFEIDPSAMSRYRFVTAP